ncbi:N-acyl amino acid synthase, PEP-CTERM/exosortase system-associated [Nitrosomonas sp. Nm51]|uniref:PEP-CTERM/exosortase system-associated acyltransferase n=1 Tax=Nitrosomonas sp. Nm51 TaxID=133720 RepID=UPI0008CC94B7|nr:PEP-CTERM/exosortase system-associated acyltransferase [Nitrosomonas sp. Nm51]SER49025.1 N-acyl amino acid synthase, PEP-CTERM/exosortase system-associated [Nitrosomonas sp. Nm51]
MREKITQLGENFQKYFEIVFAKSEEQKNSAYHVRHKVYCEELGFESIQKDKREIDEYDADSLHLLLRSKKTGEFIGCTRIIFPCVNKPGYLLPIEKVCTFDNSKFDLTTIPRNKLAEVSRLAVIADYRRRKSDSKDAISISPADFSIQKEQRFPYIPVSLYLGTMKLAHIHGIEYLFVLTEKRLAQHFSKLGFDITLIGKSIEHRGTRVPSLVCINSSISKMHLPLHSLYQIIAQDLEMCMK